MTTSALAPSARAASAAGVTPVAGSAAAATRQDPFGTAAASYLSGRAGLQGTDADWQINSVGWVCGDGRNYLMAVLTTGNPTEQYGIDTISQLAATVWQNMG